MKKLYFIIALFVSNFSLLNAQKEMGFVENKGQLADHKGNLLPDVLFQSTGTGPQIYITTSGLTYVFHKYNAVTDQDEKQSQLNWSKIEMQFSGASIKKENIVVENPLPGISNFYYAHCPQGILNVVSYHKVTIKNIYPGIDWVLNADNVKGLSHDFIVHPGGNSSLIKVIYNGTDGVPAIDKKGNLFLPSAFGSISEGGLNVYEEETGRKLQAGFEIDKNVLKYNIRNAPENATIVIDPPLQWDLPQSSTDFDYGYAVSAAHDGTGDVLVTGASDGTDFPTLNAYQGSLFGFEDMIVERLNAAGTRLWSTYYGGTDYEQGKGIASDNSGNCYVTGNTGSTDFPVLNPLQVSYGGGVYDVAILKFNSSGVRQWATWYGALSNDYGTAIASDVNGNIYVTGYTNSTGFPTVSAIQPTKGISYDAFLIKIGSNAAVQWATFYGGDDDDKGRAITIDALGVNIYVTGTTLSGGFPVTSGVFQTSSGSAYNAEDAFVLKINAAQVVQWASYCGGSDADFGQGIAVDNAGKIFITGYTLSSDYPVLDPGNGAFYNGTIGSLATHDGFVTEISADGSSRIWSTYLGGSAVDLGFAIAYDPAAGIYVCGNTSSTDFPTHQPIDNTYYQSTQGDGGNFNDMFICWFGPNDSLKWSTYYGGANSDEAYGICIDAGSNIFVTGVENNDLAMLKFNPAPPLGIGTTNSGDMQADIYPSPASQTLFVNLNFNASTNLKLEIFDSNGKCVLNDNHVANPGKSVYPIDVASFADGIYFLKIYSPNGVQEEKFVKE